MSPHFFSEAAVKRPTISECGESADSVDDHTDFADFNDDQDNNHLEFSDSGGGNDSDLSEGTATSTVTQNELSSTCSSECCVNELRVNCIIHIASS